MVRSIHDTRACHSARACVSLRKLRVAGSLVDLDVIREGHRLIVDVVDDGGLRINAYKSTDAAGCC
jgi:hypothetical protein